MNLKRLWLHRRFVTNHHILLRIAKGFLNRIVFERDVLRSIELSVTKDCNFNCPMCYARDINKKAKKELTLREIMELVILPAYKFGLTHVNITGGEPLLRKDINRIIYSIRTQCPGVIISLVTNGWLCDLETLNTLKRNGLNTIQISLDSMFPKIHDKGRGVKHAWCSAMSAIRLAKRAGLNVCISSVTRHKNLSEFEQLMDYAAERDCFILINTPGTVGGWKKAKGEQLTPKEMRQVRCWWKHPHVREDNMFNFTGKPGCPAGREKLYVSSDGEVMPCDRLQRKYGNVRTHKLEAIWWTMLQDFTKNVMCYRYDVEYKGAK